MQSESVTFLYTAPIVFLVLAVTSFFQYLGKSDRHSKRVYGMSVLFFNFMWVLDLLILLWHGKPAITQYFDYFVVAMCFAPLAYFCAGFAYLFEYVFNGRIKEDYRFFALCSLMGFFSSAVVYAVRAWVTV